jgi:hypothetical protein
MLRWLCYDEMQETEDETEYLANLLLERGCAALGIWWERVETLTRETISMAPIMQAAQQAQQRLQRGEQGDALLFQAQLPILITDPTLEAQAIQVVAALARRIICRMPSCGRLSRACARRARHSSRARL